MTITPFAIYIISLADNIILLLRIIAMIWAILVVIFIVKLITLDADSDHPEIISKLSMKDIKLSLIGFIVFLPLSFFCPSTKTLLAMYTIPPIVNNQEIQKLPMNLLNFANDYLEKREEKK
jgi:hypothetical protein